MKSFNQVRGVIGWVAALIVLAWMSAGANAGSTVINVDFNVNVPSAYQGSFPLSGTYVGLGAAPDVATNTFWNGVVTATVPNAVSSFTSGSLTASDGATPTTVNFTLTDFAPQDQQNSYGANTFAPDLFGDDVINKVATGTSTFSIQGLDAGAPYDLYLYSMGQYSNANDTTFTVDGVAGSTTTITGDPATYGSAFAGVTAGTTGGGNYVLYTHVIASDGTISGTWSGSNQRFNGLQLVEVPEPASLGLIAVGGVMLLRRRRA